MDLVVNLIIAIPIGFGIMFVTFYALGTWAAICRKLHGE